MYCEFIWIKRSYTDYLIFNTKSLKIVSRKATIEEAIRTTNMLNRFICQ